MYLQLFFVRDYYSKESTWMLEFFCERPFYVSLTHSTQKFKMKGQKCGTCAKKRSNTICHLGKTQI